MEYTFSIILHILYFFNLQLYMIIIIFLLNAF